MTDLRCYVCGKPLGAMFSLISMSKNVDRVFLVDGECVEEVRRDATVIVPVERSKVKS